MSYLASKNLIVTKMSAHIIQPVWVFVSKSLAGNSNNSEPLLVEEFVKSSSEYNDGVLRGETKRSTAVTFGNTDYFNSSIIT